MKSQQKMTIGVVMAGVLALPVLVWAAQDYPKAHTAHEEASAKLFRDAAAALQAAHPELAQGLTALANEEASEHPKGKKGKEPKQEVEGKAEKEVLDRREAQVKLLRDSAGALQTARPDLAAQLTKVADRKTRRLTKEQKEDAKEIEEQ